MTEKELIQKNIEEFSRLVDLKAILTASGVNLTELDRIKA